MTCSSTATAHGCCAVSPVPLCGRVTSSVQLLPHSWEGKPLMATACKHPPAAAALPLVLTYLQLQAALELSGSPAFPYAPPPHPPHPVAPRRTRRALTLKTRRVRELTTTYGTDSNTLGTPASLPRLLNNTRVLGMLHTAASGVPSRRRFRDRRPVLSGRTPPAAMHCGSPQPSVGPLVPAT